MLVAVEIGSIRSEYEGKLEQMGEKLASTEQARAQVLSLHAIMVERLICD